MTRTLRGKVAVGGVGETTYYKHGQSPHSEFKLALQAILAACEDAGIDPRRIDGFASYSNDRNDPSRIAAALGLPALRFSNMNWGGGGGGGSAAVGNAAAAVACGIANCVVVFRALAQGQFQRFGAAPAGGTATGEAALNAPYGVMSPAQRYAMRAMRFLHENRIADSAAAPVHVGEAQRRQAERRGETRRIVAVVGVGGEAVDPARIDAGVVAGRQDRLQGELELRVRRLAVLEIGGLAHAGDGHLAAQCPGHWR